MSSITTNEWLIDFEEDLPEKHSFEIDGKVRVMPKPSSDIQKNTTFLSNIINEETDLMPNVSGSSFHQDKYSYGESGHILHSSGYLEELHVSHSSNLRNSTPKSSVVSQSNNLPRTPEIESFDNSPCNLQSSTPKASSRLSPFASDLTEVEFAHKNIYGMNQNTEVKHCKGLSLAISNDLFEFQSNMDSLEHFKNSNYEDCMGSSLNVLKLRCHSTQNTSQMSTYFSANGLKTPTTDVKLPMLTNKALKVPNKLQTNSEYKITENVLQTSDANSSRLQENFSILNSSEDKYSDEVNKTCNSESLFESFNNHDSNLISLQNKLACKPNCNCTDEINLIDFSSDSNCKSLSIANEAFESTDKFAFQDSLTVNNCYNKSVYEIMHDILNHLPQEIRYIDSPDHFTEKKTCSFSDESNFLKEVFCVFDNTENLEEVSKVESLEGKTLNLSQFLADAEEINRVTNERELNTENVNLKNDFDFLNVRNNITAYQRNLGGIDSEATKAQEIPTNTNQKQYENSFHRIICKELSNLTSGTFSSSLDVCSNLSKSKRQSRELLFVNSKPEISTREKFAKNSKDEECSRHTRKLTLKKLKSFKMGFEGGSNISILSNFKTLSGKNIENINLSSMSICNVQESMVIFEAHKVLSISCSHNLFSITPSNFPQSAIISLHKLITNKNNSLNSCYDNQPHMKCVASKIKPQDTLSNNFDFFLKSDLFSLNSHPSAFGQNGISLKLCGLSTNSKTFDTHQMSNESKVFEYFESKRDKYLNSEIISKSKAFQNGCSNVTKYDESLSSQPNMFDVSRFPEDISGISNNFPANNRLYTSMKSSPESFETDIPMTSNSDSESSLESNKESEHGSKSQPLQDLFDVDKLVAKAVLQTFTDLGSSRGFKLSQIVKHINQRKIIKVHSKLNQDIQNFLKVSCEVGIIRKKKFKYFLPERTRSLSKKKKVTKNKCKTPKGKEELKMKFPTSTKIKTRRSSLEMITPTGIKTRRAVFKVETLGSTKIKVKRDTTEIIIPTRIKTGRASFQVETPTSARIKKLRKNSSKSSNAKCLFSGNKKSPICQRTEIVLGTPSIYKKLRSRVILLKKNG